MHLYTKTIRNHKAWCDNTIGTTPVELFFFACACLLNPLSRFCWWWSWLKCCCSWSWDYTQHYSLKCPYIILTTICLLCAIQCQVTERWNKQKKELFYFSFHKCLFPDLLQYMNMLYADLKFTYMFKDKSNKIYLCMCSTYSNYEDPLYLTKAVIICSSCTILKFGSITKWHESPDPSMVL